MEQLLTVDTINHIMYVMVDNKLIKTIKNVFVGKNGTTSVDKAIEGDMKTPLGLFNLGVAFGIHDLSIDYPYIKIDDGSFWVDDNNSKYYNCFVELGRKVDDFGYSYIFNLDEKEFSSAEHLISYKEAYEYAIFIEFNVCNKNHGNNKGSAIFLHCGSSYTHGCVAVSRDDMLWILNFLDRNKNPKILIK